MLQQCTVERELSSIVMAFRVFCQNELSFCFVCTCQIVLLHQGLDGGKTKAFATARQTSVLSIDALVCA